jgi:hypothetical protein
MKERMVKNMNKKFLRNAVLALVGTTFAISAVAYPVLSSGLQMIRPIASGASIVEASGAVKGNTATPNEDDKLVAEAAGIIPEEIPDQNEVVVEEEASRIVRFAGEVAAVTKAELEGIADEVTAQKGAWANDMWKSVEPAVVVKAKARALGLDPQIDKFVQIDNKDGKAEILVTHGVQKYILTLAFIPGKGWVLESSREVVDNVQPSNKIITGTVKLNMSKLADQQKLANYGYQTWRLDPLQVAKYQGVAFGFDKDEDSFKLLPGTKIYRENGEANVLVKHGKKEYIMHLFQPFGNSNDKIWTIKSVREVKLNGGDKPTVPAKGTIYSNHLLDKWTWSKGSLPKDMAYTAVIDLDYQRNKDNRFRSDIWNAISSYDHENNVLLLAYLGAMPTGGYDIGIRKVSVNGKVVTVQVAFKSPASGSIVTQAKTYPFDVVLIPKNKLALDKQVTFKFVDGNGKLLTTVEATVK